MQSSCDMMNNSGHNQDWKRGKMKYYIETIFKPPENLTYPNFQSGSNNCSFSADSGQSGEYVVIDMKSVFQQVSQLVKCRRCAGDVIFSRAQIVGLGFKLVVNCQNCGEVGRIDSSKIIGPTSNDYEVNARNEQACQYLAGMSVSHTSMTNQTMMNSQGQYYGSPLVRNIPATDIRLAESGGMQYQEHQQHPQNMQGYYPQTQWHNQNVFHNQHQASMGMHQGGSWQMGSENHIPVPEVKVECIQDEIDSEADEDEDDDDEDSEGVPQLSGFENMHDIQRQADSRASSDYSSKGRRRAIKKERGEGQRLTSDTPLPNFSSYVLAELAKPAPKMSVVLPPCKAHIIAVTGDEYPTKKEYEVFSLKMILAFPSLKDPDTDHGFERFKKSLSASFRSRRSYENNIKPNRVSKRSFEWRPPSSAGSLSTDADPNCDLSFNQPSTSASNMDRLDDEEHSRDMERSYGDSDSENSELSANTSHHNDGQRRKRRKIVKKLRGEGQSITSETPLPDFSVDVLTELAKPTPRMSVVLPPCKAHIVAVTGDEYPTKKEYEVFSLKMIMAFPSLKDPDTEYGFERFKKSLSSSFRARRSYEKNIKPGKGKRVLVQEPMPPIDVSLHRSLLPPAYDEEMRTADEELTRTNCNTEPDKAKYLIEKSFNHRRKIVSSAGFDDQIFLQTYQHLSICDMLLYEYSLIVSIGIQELRANFDEGLLVLSKMLWETSQFSNIDEDLRKVQVLVQLQEHFLNQRHIRVDPNTKPLFVIKDEMAAFNDGDTSFRGTLVPCALVLSQGGRISKLMITHKDRIVLEKYDASAFDACSSLLAFFFILNIKYPPVYLDNLKALERLLNKKLSLSSLQTTISSPYSNYVKLYDAKLKEVLPYFKPTVPHV
ncbi:hypothetical protein ONE63_000599 [Megalurothrips usitatus]|uniref:Uncharacterized protein n=1 Tax=Megalurothrips usitatus TaxID=439358 RepID=A0AAV7Y2F8_9NEOP|nr:hypothetical protein ONE63_000599 [Megalurothrips usitatus]